MSGDLKKKLDSHSAVCYTMDAVNEGGCLKGEPMNRQPKKGMINAAYERLSRDDELQGPSNSIINQKALLEEYAANNGITNLSHFTDDGISGSRWDRPGFTKLMDEIEAGRVSVLLVKDTSRIGRDYLRVGLFMETLRQKGVRLIAIGDNVDTAFGEDDFMPFRNIFAEWHARDTSRKIKQIYKSKGMNGKHTSSHAVYGYVKCETDKNQWLVDPEAADVVRRIFRMTIAGKGPYKIAATLESEKIPSPAYYLAQQGMGSGKNKTYDDPYRWHGTSVADILERVEYTGSMVNFKTYKTSYKDKRYLKTPTDQLVINEDAHEAIIDRETWETVNRIRSNTKRRRTSSLGDANPLTGLMYCSGCGSKLYNERGYDPNGKWKDSYICSGYKGKVPDCSAHRIRTDAVNDLVLDTLRAVSEYARNNEAGFTRQVNEMFSVQQDGTAKAQRKKLAASQKRRDELDRLIQRIYEDMVAGRITDKRFDALSSEYEREQSELEQTITELQAVVESFDDSAARAAGFLELTRRYRDFSELTAPMLHEFVRKIVVHERAEKKVHYTTQKVEIYLNFIERYSPPATEDAVIALPDPKQQARERKRAYSREYKRRRKENGGKPLTSEDTRTPEQIADDKAAKRERKKAYNREYQRTYKRKLAREKRENKATESGLHSYEDNGSHSYEPPAKSA